MFSGELLLCAPVRHHYGELESWVRARLETRQAGFVRDAVRDVCVRLMERPQSQATAFSRIDRDLTISFDMLMKIIIV